MFLLQMAEQMDELGTVPDMIILISLIAVFAFIAWRISESHKEAPVELNNAAASPSVASAPTASSFVSSPAKTAAITAAITAAVTEYQKSNNKL